MYDKLIPTLAEAFDANFICYWNLHVSHWNVTGPNFPQYHELFRKQYEDVFTAVDGLAEQLRQLDVYISTQLPIESIVTQSVNAAARAGDAEEIIRERLTDHARMIVILTKCFTLATEENLQGLANYLADRIQAHTFHRWQLKATLAN